MTKPKAYYILVYKAGETCPIFIARVTEHIINEHNDLVVIYDMDDNSHTQNLWYSYDWDYFHTVDIDEFSNAIKSTGVKHDN